MCNSGVEGSLARSQAVSQKIRQTSFAGIISESPVMWKLFGLIEKVAKTNSTVLVLGESGTGKELVAKAIHKISGRVGRLVPVNCGAIPEEILESELFGHEKGAFTGATSSRIGRFQLADGGTIFLDEIGEMSPKLQVKLLRFLQEHVVEPVGATRSMEVNVRVIAATNKDLKEEVRAGRFREDLFYRLQVIPIQLPSLRERSSDIPILANFFIKRACAENGRESISFESSALSKLLLYGWPGNVRELENLVERLSILCDGNVISESELPDYIVEGSRGGALSYNGMKEIPEEGIDFNQLVNDFEIHLIATALCRTNGNKKAAAELLRLNRTTLVEKIKKKNLEQEYQEVTPQQILCERNSDEVCQ